MEEKINITPAGDKLTILKGEARRFFYPMGISALGIITAPADYYEHHKMDAPTDEQYIDPKTAIVKVDYSARSVELLVNPKDSSGMSNSIMGTLDLSDDLEVSRIYDGTGSVKTFDRPSLMKFLRFNSKFFPNKEEYKIFLDKINKLDLSFSGRKFEDSDIRGNATMQKEMLVRTSIPEAVTMEVRVFKGYPAQKFTVTIGIEYVNNNASFWLECITLAEYIEKESEEIIDGVITRLNGLYKIEI